MRAWPYTLSHTPGRRTSARCARALRSVGPHHGRVIIARVTRRSVVTSRRYQQRHCAGLLRVCRPTLRPVMGATAVDRLRNRVSLESKAVPDDGTARAHAGWCTNPGGRRSPEIRSDRTNGRYTTMDGGACGIRGSHALRELSSRRCSGDTASVFFTGFGAFCAITTDKLLNLLETCACQLVAYKTGRPQIQP